jgi:hypothetical protein
MHAGRPRTAGKHSSRSHHVPTPDKISGCGQVPGVLDGVRVHALAPPEAGADVRVPACGPAPHGYVERRDDPCGDRRGAFGAQAGAVQYAEGLGHARAGGDRLRSGADDRHHPALQTHVSEVVRGLPPLASQLSM